MNYQYKATILDVYDGDTCRAQIDLGLNVHTVATLRLHGINAPELKGESKSAGVIARDHLRDLVLNKEVIVHTYKDKKEKYGRWLAAIFIGNDGGISVNQEMIDSGNAVPFLP